MASIWFLKVMHAKEQETDQNINIKYASWSLGSSWYVWGNHCSLNQGAPSEYYTALCCSIYTYMLSRLSSRIVCIGGLNVVVHKESESELASFFCLGLDKEEENVKNQRQITCGLSLI